MLAQCSLFSSGVKVKSADPLQTGSYQPRVPPVAMARDIWDSSSGDGFRAPSVAAMPPATPIMPRVLPRRLVRWAERPASAPTQHMPEPRYIIWRETQIRFTWIVVIFKTPNNTLLYFLNCTFMVVLVSFICFVLLLCWEWSVSLWFANFALVLNGPIEIKRQYYS